MIFKLKNVNFTILNSRSTQTINDINVDKIIVSTKISLCIKGFKYFICYKDDDEKVNPLCIMFSKMIGYVKSFDETKSISFLIKTNEFFKKYNEN